MPQISVIIPTLGSRPTWLLECVNSLRLQGVDHELMIVSTKPREHIVRQIGELQANELFLGQEQGGLSAAINQGAAESQSTYLTWIGDDDLLAPKSLARSFQFLEHNLAAPFVYGHTRYIDEVGRTIGIVRPTKLASSYLTIGHDFVPQPGSLIRRTAFAAVGGLRTDLRNAMDLDLFIRLRALGRPGYLPVELSAYRLHPDSITLTKTDRTDEGELVRAAYRGRLAHRTRRLWRPVTDFAERAYLWGAFHYPFYDDPYLERVTLDVC